MRVLLLWWLLWFVIIQELNWMVLLTVLYNFTGTTFLFKYGYRQTVVGYKYYVVVHTSNFADGLSVHLHRSRELGRRV